MNTENIEDKLLPENYEPKWPVEFHFKKGVGVMLVLSFPIPFIEFGDIGFDFGIQMKHLMFGLEVL